VPRKNDVPFQLQETPSPTTWLKQSVNKNMATAENRRWTSIGLTFLVIGILSGFVMCFHRIYHGITMRDSIWKVHFQKNIIKEIALSSAQWEVQTVFIQVDSPKDSCTQTIGQYNFLKEAKSAVSALSFNNQTIYHVVPPDCFLVSDTTYRLDTIFLIMTIILVSVGSCLCRCQTLHVSNHNEDAIPLNEEL
jgi:hypothetical protein